MEKDAIGRYKVVVIGGSAGSLDVIFTIISTLPEQTGASFIIVVHRKYDPRSILAELLSARTSKTVIEIEDKDPIHPNTIYLAPPDYHLLIENENTFSLDYSEKVHFSRPSIDTTFESVADVFGDRAIGILLSGANADGADGLASIKRAGGFTIVQDPSSSEVDFMPLQAIKQKAYDKILPTEEIAGYIKFLLGEA